MVDVIVMMKKTIIKNSYCSIHRALTNFVSVSWGSPVGRNRVVSSRPADGSRRKYLIYYANCIYTVCHTSAKYPFSS